MSGMSTEHILDEIKQMGMQNKNAYYIQQASQKIKHGPWGGHIPQDAKDLCKFEGIGDKMSFLVTQYVYGKVQVSTFSSLQLNNWLFNIDLMSLFSFYVRHFLWGPHNVLGTCNALDSKK